ncbi:MAG: CopG family transcriptional regulator [Deltaproteobacteria bacterium]|nr:MAG: CopG family transcriptional regulator [Deltaproteobacteria bacterium]
MSKLTNRATVYLEPELHRVLRLKSIETSRSMSELINEAVREAMAEDAEDLATFTRRRKEPLLSFENFLKELQRNGTI